MGATRSSEVDVLSGAAPGGGGGGGRLCAGAGGAAPGIGGGRLIRLFPGDVGDSSSPPKELLVPADRGEVGTIVGEAMGIGGGGARPDDGASALGVSSVCI